MFYALHADLSQLPAQLQPPSKTIGAMKNEAAADVWLTEALVAATILQFVALAYQGLWLRRSVKVSERNFNELERAYVFPSHKEINGSVDNPLSIQYTMRNIGRTPAIIRGFRICFSNSGTLPPAPDYSRGELQYFNWAIAGGYSGDTKVFRSPYIGRQFFYVEIEFLDIFGNKQFSRAASEWQPEGFGDEGATREAGGEPYNSWSQTRARRV